jgi:hypothetical protein
MTRAKIQCLSIGMSTLTLSVSKQSEQNIHVYNKYAVYIGYYNFNVYKTSCDF